MARTTWKIALGIAVMASLLEYAWSQCSPGYSAGSATIGDIQTECVEQYPAPQTRTDVGIGEEVTCSIDESTWQAYAIYTDSYCNTSQVNDPLGSIVWLVSGPGSIYPTTGDTVTLSVDLADEDGVITVSATATDSLFVDAPAQKQKVLNAKVPTGLQALSATDDPPNTWQQGNNNLGASSELLIQVMPTNVNFNNIQLQDSFSALAFTWPDGKSKTSIPASASSTYEPDSVGNTNNLISSTVSTADLGSPGLIPIAQIAGQPYTVKYTATVNYKDKMGMWLAVGGPGSLISEYLFNNATNKTQVGVIVTNTLTGGLQGPWK